MIIAYIIPFPGTSQDFVDQAARDWRAAKWDAVKVAAAYADAHALGEIWLRLAQHTLERVPDAWALLLHPTMLPSSGLREALAQAAQEPALLVCLQQFTSGARCLLDWRQATPNKPLDYDMTAPTAYGDTGGICLPLHLLRDAMMQVTPDERLWGNGPNIALANACRNMDVPIRLVRDALVYVR